MAKLAFFAFTLTAIVAFSELSAYTTAITTTTIEDNGHGSAMDSLDNPKPSQTQCPKIPEKSACYAHILRDIPHMITPKQGVLVQQIFEECCTNLKKATKQCQCDTINQTYTQALPKASMEIHKQRIFSYARNLLKECKLEVQDCKLAAPKG